MKYSIDTSSIIHARRFHYPPEVFPLLWARLEELIETGRLVATEEVRVELDRKDDEILTWAREQQKLFVPIDEDIQIAVQELLNEHPGLLDLKKNRSGADPFVIALAKLRTCTVVTNEVRSNNPAKPKIPDVCHALGIPCIDFLSLVKEERWVFG